MSKEPPKSLPAVPPAPAKKKHWTERISRSGYFFGALLFHIIVFVMIATLVIFPPFHAPTDEFQKTYVPASAPPPPPPPSQPAVQVPTQTVMAPTTITAPTATPTFNVPLPDITPTTQVTVTQKMTTPVQSKTNTMSDARLASIMSTEQNAWGRSKDNIMNSDSDPRNVIATFPVFVASYADGDWNCNTVMDWQKGGIIDAGSMANLVAKMNEWSHGHLTGTVEPKALDIGGPDLLDKKPPFIFFTGHKDFKLTDQEVQNLRDYLQVGGAIWGDNALPGRGSRFDIAFRREMKRVVPDLDKNFEPVKITDDLFTKSWFPIQKLPPGMNYYTEDIQHLDIDGKLAILYTPNDYSDMLCMRILPGDDKMGRSWLTKRDTSPLITTGLFFYNRNVFFRNFELPACLEVDKLGMNIIGYLLVRFDKDMLLAP
jgi:hypothetical protein